MGLTDVAPRQAVNKLIPTSPVNLPLTRRTAN